MMIFMQKEKSETPEHCQTRHKSKNDCCPGKKDGDCELW